MDRNATLDNAKFLMVVLVVFGHLIYPIFNAGVIVKTVFLSIYSFHMPVFVIISGMLSKAEYSKEQTNKAIASVLIPYLVFTVLYEAFSFAIYGHISGYMMGFKPYWLLWFLYSLFIWRMVLPFVLRFSYPVLASIIISLIAGYIDSIGYFLGISKTLYFFPFFIIGHKLSAGVLANRRLTSIPKSVYLGFLVLNVGIFWWLDAMTNQWLYGGYSYNEMEFYHWYAAAVRLCFYCLSAVTVVSVFMLIPRRKSIITKFGSNALYVYLWHGFFVKALQASGAIGGLVTARVPEPLALAIIFLGAVIITLLLSLDFVAVNTQRFILNPLKRALPSGSN